MEDCQCRCPICGKVVIDESNLENRNYEPIGERLSACEHVFYFYNDLLDYSATRLSEEIEEANAFLRARGVEGADEVDRARVRALLRKMASAPSWAAHAELIELPGPGSPHGDDPPIVGPSWEEQTWSSTHQDTWTIGYWSGKPDESRTVSSKTSAGASAAKKTGPKKGPPASRPTTITKVQAPPEGRKPRHRGGVAPKTKSAPARRKKGGRGG